MAIEVRSQGGAYTDRFPDGCGFDWSFDQPGVFTVQNEHEAVFFPLATVRSIKITPEPMTSPEGSGGPSAAASQPRGNT